MTRPPSAPVRAALVCGDGDAVQLELFTVEEKAVLALVLGEDDTASVSLALAEQVAPLKMDWAQQACCTGAAQLEQHPAAGAAAVAEVDAQLEQQQAAEAAAALQQQHAQLLQENQRLQGLVRQVRQQQNGCLGCRQDKLVGALFAGYLPDVARGDWRFCLPP